MSREILARYKIKVRDGDKEIACARANALVVLTRRTYWRCGRIQKRIVKYLMKKGKAVPVEELLKLFPSLTWRTRLVVKRVVTRLAKRHIVKVKLI